MSFSSKDIQTRSFAQVLPFSVSKTSFPDVPESAAVATSSAVCLPFLPDNPLVDLNVKSQHHLTVVLLVAFGLCDCLVIRWWPF